MLLSLSLLLRPAARGIREDVTFILQQFPNLPPSHLFGRIHRRQPGQGDLDLGGSLAALRQKKKRFPYQIPSSAFCAIRILQQQLPPRTRTVGREGRKEGPEWRAEGACQIFSYSDHVQIAREGEGERERGKWKWRTKGRGMARRKEESSGGRRFISAAAAADSAANAIPAAAGRRPTAAAAAAFRRPKGRKKTTTMEKGKWHAKVTKNFALSPKHETTFLANELEDIRIPRNKSARPSQLDRPPLLLKCGRTNNPIFISILKELSRCPVTVVQSPLGAE